MDNSNNSKIGNVNLPASTINALSATIEGIYLKLSLCGDSIRLYSTDNSKPVEFMLEEVLDELAALVEKFNAMQKMALGGQHV